MGSPIVVSRQVGAGFFLALGIAAPVPPARAEIQGAELAFVELPFVASGTAGTPEERVLAYGIFDDQSEGTFGERAVLYDGFAIAPSSQLALLDLGPGDDPDFAAVAAAVRQGAPAGTHFAFTLALPGQAATLKNASTSIALSVPLGTCVQGFRLEVPPFAYVEGFGGYYESQPWPVLLRLRAFGVATSPLADTDGDSLVDAAEEFVYGTDPCSADTDADGLVDPAEIFSAPYGTDPLDPDSDGDAHLDGADNCPAAFYEETGRSGFNPGQADADGDGRGDACDPDNDGDSVPDAADACPLEPAQGFDADLDGCRDTLPGLIDRLAEAGLDGPSKSLQRKAADAWHLLCEVGNEQGALNKLDDIAQYLDVQAGQQIPAQTAGELAHYAQNLVEQILAGGDVCGGL